MSSSPAGAAEPWWPQRRPSRPGGRPKCPKGCGTWRAATPTRRSCRICRGSSRRRPGPALAPLHAPAAASWRSGCAPGSGPTGCRPSAVTFAHGALDCIARLLTTELRPGDAVAMEDPGYHHLLDLLHAMGLRTIPVAVDDEGMRPEAAARRRCAAGRGPWCAVHGRRIRTAVASRAARRDELVEVLRQAPDVLVIENDHAAEIAGAELNSLTDGRAYALGAGADRDQVPGHRPAVGGRRLRSGDAGAARRAAAAHVRLGESSAAGGRAGLAGRPVGPALGDAGGGHLWGAAYGVRQGAGASAGSRRTGRAG